MAQPIAASPIPKQKRWLVVVGGLLMNLALGSLYGWSLFVPSLEADMGLSREEASNIFSFSLATISICFLIGGRLQDKKGPYIVSMIGSVCIGAGYMLASQAESLTGMYLSYGVVGGIGVGFGYVTPIGVASKWFPDRRGLVIGLMVAGFGAGSAILGPLVPAFIGYYGWRSVMMGLGVIYLVTTMIGAQFVRNPPPGWTLPGWTPSPQAAANMRDFGPAEVLRTSQFWRIVAGYALGASAGLMVISQVVPFLRGVAPQLGPAVIGTTALVVGALGNAGGRFFSGWLSDHFGRVRTLCLMLLISVALLPVLGRTTEVSLLWVVLLVVYYCYGTQLSVYASLTADFFGTKNLGANYGLVFLGLGMAGIIGPKLGGALFDRYLSYTLAFDIAAGLLVVALALIATLRPPRAVAP